MGFSQTTRMVHLGGEPMKKTVSLWKCLRQSENHGGRHRRNRGTMFTPLTLLLLLLFGGTHSDAPRNYSRLYAQGYSWWCFQGQYMMPGIEFRQVVYLASMMKPCAIFSDLQFRNFTLKKFCKVQFGCGHRLTISSSLYGPMTPTGVIP